MKVGGVCKLDRWGRMKYEPDRPCITSTPKSDKFVKKQRKCPKYERDSCIPGPKNGERPYLAVPEATFWGLFFDLFWANFLAFYNPPILFSSTIQHLNLTLGTSHSTNIHITTQLYNT